MKSLSSTPIQYIGIEKSPDILYKNFSELHLTHHLGISGNKPKISFLTTAHLNFSLKDKKIIKTIKGVSLDNVNLTGYKLIIHGILEEKVEYIDKSPESSLHNVNFTIPFSSSILVTESMCNQIKLDEIKIYIQHIHTKIENPHSLYQNINIILSY